MLVRSVLAVLAIRSGALIRRNYLSLVADRRRYVFARWSCSAVVTSRERLVWCSATSAVMAASWASLTRMVVCTDGSVLVLFCGTASRSWLCAGAVVAVRPDFRRS